MTGCECVCVCCGHGGAHYVCLVTTAGLLNPRTSTGDETSHCQSCGSGLRIETLTHTHRLRHPIDEVDSAHSHSAVEVEAFLSTFGRQLQAFARSSA